MNNKIFKTQQKPYKVFNTEEEFNEAVMQAIDEYTREYDDEENSSEAIRERILEEAEALKEKFPEFDLKQMLRENPKFREYVLKGYSLEEAFYLANRTNAAASPKKKLGIRENGRSRYMGGGANRNVKNMSDDDFKRYIDSIMGSKL